MKEKFKNFIRDLFSSYFYANHSFAQEGEDLVINRLLEGKKTGIYVEVGCHHPFRFSNTYFFYKKGWKGICIDALPGTVEKFKRWRPRDNVVEMGVSSKEGVLTYYMFNEPALNTFDERIANEKNEVDGYRIIGRKSVAVNTLVSILDRVDFKSDIDFFSVDVEGLDLDVLKSNDWNRYRPKVVVAESLSLDGDIFQDEVYKYLVSIDYRFYAKTGNSLVYVDAGK